MNHALERTEHREALGWGILLALVTTLPYLLGYLGTPDGKYFLGFVLNPGSNPGWGGPFSALGWTQSAGEF